MLEIVKHLYQYKTTTYKEIEQSLGIKERNVRYDVDRINEILAENGLEQIERKGKGVLEDVYKRQIITCPTRRCIIHVEFYISTRCNLIICNNWNI